MTLKLQRRTLLMAAGASMMLPATTGLAMTEHVVQMLNKHPENDKLRQVFFPRIIAVQPGDTVTFQATDRGHNSASTDGMVPDGAEGWKGSISKDVSVTFDTPGFYGYRCVPHASLGMVGLVVVEGDGKLDNLAAAQGVNQRGKAKAAWDEIWAEAEAMGLLA